VLTKIWVKHFRNLGEQVIGIHPKITVICGQNNQGKTNFLEAIYYLLSGQSFNRATVEQLICHSQKYARLGGLLRNTPSARFSGSSTTPLRLTPPLLGSPRSPINRTSGAFLNSPFGSELEKDFKLYLHLSEEAGKRIEFDGELLKSYSRVKDLVSVQYFSADVLWLFQESPAFRRSFLDGFCGKYYPGFVSLERKYQGVIRQKNALLALDDVDRRVLSILNGQLAEFGSEIVRIRCQALNEMMGVVKGYTRGYFDCDSEDIHGVYQVGTGKVSVPFDQFKAWYTQVLLDNVDKEIKVGQSLYGPHRDDFFILIKGRPMVGYFSRGMCRIMALLLSFSQLVIVSGRGERFPVLLLDDAFCELDSVKKAQLMADFSALAQVVYTSVSNEDYHIFGDCIKYELCNGVFCDSPEGSDHG
jgi:DNA replication and repair protein RecF